MSIYQARAKALDPILMKEKERAGKMAQWVEVLATKADNMSLFRGAPREEKENQFPQVIFWTPHPNAGTYIIHAYIHRIKERIKGGRKLIVES